MKIATFALRGPFYALPILTLLLCATPPRAEAQKVYRCGSVYSQTPCDGAVVIDVQDSRTLMQKQETDQAIARNTKTLKNLESTRAKEEKLVAAQNALALKEAEQRKQAEKQAIAAQEKAAAQTAKKAPKSNKDPDFFTAATKEKPTEKKPARP